MFLTRSIRRKMATFVALVMLMLAVLVGTAAWGLYGYRRFVNDPDFNVLRTARRADLVEALGGLIEPEWVGVSRPVAHGEQISRTDRIAAVRRRLREYRFRWQELPESAPQRLVAEALLAQIEWQLAALSREFEAEGERPTAEHVGRQAARVQQMIALAEQIPDTQQDIRAKAAEAHADYRFSFWMLCGSTAVVFLLFAALLWFLYRSLFRPIRELHEGASRVAQGNFAWTVRIDTDDEMAELAAAFNRMTEQFCRKRDELDREVQQRSEQLLRTQQLVGPGFLAAGVAHEINNPLAAIRWSADALAGRIDAAEHTWSARDAEAVRKYLETVRSEADRCRTITSRLLEFCRGVDEPRQRADVALLLREVVETIELLGRFRDRKVTVNAETSTFAEVKRVEFKQVALNLIANAVDSTVAGGEITLSLEERADDVILRIVDNGAGIDSADLAYLFQPFYTRGKAGRGTGLGLAICHRIVTEHGGRIQATSGGPGMGAVFTVHWPKSAAATGTVSGTRTSANDSPSRQKSAADAA